MIDAAMREAGDDGCSFVTLGLAPLAGEDSMLRATRSLMRGFYNFEGLHTFKSKLRPDGWTPIYLAWPEGRTAAGALFDALDAFAGGHIVRFAIQAVLRAPPPVLAALGILLIPWTVTMTFADTRHWFPSRRIQIAWCVFDVAMAASLLSLSRRWRTPLAIATGAAATADGVLTTLQAATHNVRRARGIGDVLVITAAIAAPFAAAAILLTPVLLQLRGKSRSGTESHGIESRDRVSARHRKGGHRRGAHDGLRQAQVLGSGRGGSDARGAEQAQDARLRRDR
jgi:phosphatidylglycerol lysyltransferase